MERQLWSMGPREIDLFGLEVSWLFIVFIMYMPITDHITDMGIAVPSIFVSTNDMISVENGLNSLFDEQTSNGQLPWGGRPLPMIQSNTYQLYTLIGVANHFQFTVSLIATLFNS